MGVFLFSVHIVQMLRFVHLQGMLALLQIKVH